VESIVYLALAISIYLVSGCRIGVIKDILPSVTLLSGNVNVFLLSSPAEKMSYPCVPCLVGISDSALWLRDRRIVWLAQSKGTVKENLDEKLYQVWDERWRGSEESERVTFVGRLMFKAKARAMRKVLSDLPVQTVIEVGCALGYTMGLYYTMGFDVNGIDVSPHAIKVCKNKGLKVELCKVEEVKEKYDLVSCDGMLEHFLNFEPYAQHLMRISNRYVLLIQPNHESFCGKTLVYIAELFRGRENVHEYNYRIKDFIGVFEKSGFVIIRNLPVFFDVFRLLTFERGQ
jgi:hypothetical protein